MRTRLILMAFCLFYGYAATAQLNEAAGLRASLVQLRDSTQYVNTLNRLAMLLYEKSIDSTFNYSVRAREIADRLKYERGKADAMNNLGIVFEIKGNLQLALKYYNEAYTGYTRLHDTSNRVQTLMNMAMVYKVMGKDGRAIQQYNDALKLGGTLKRDSIMSLALYNYALMFPERLTPAARQQNVNKAKAIATKYKDERTLLAIDQLIADDLISHGQKKEGLAMLERALQSALDKKLYYVSMDMIAGAADQLLNTDTAKAAAYYQRGLAISKQNGYLIYQQVFTRKLFDLHNTYHNAARATAYAKMHMALQEEREQLNNASSIDYLDYALKDQQFKALSSRSSYQVIFLILLASVCLLAIGLLIVIRRALLRTRKLNKQISENNEQLLHTLAALEQSQADNTRMMQIVAHDLRNPIGAITSIATIMLDEEERSEDDRMMLELIRTSSNNSLELVSDVLQVHARPEEMPLEPVDLDRMLQYCADLLENKASAKGQRIELRSAPLPVPANREKLWRVLSNLIANAIKFSPTGETIKVTLANDERNALIAVEDHGIGIPQELGSRIFDMFTEARRAGTAGEQSFGLGLAISRQIIEAHGGKIWFESRLNKGTTFFVELPLRSASYPGMVKETSRV